MARRSIAPVCCALASLFLITPAFAAAQQQPATGKITPLASVRLRGEAWNWFGDHAGGDYSYFGAIARLGLEQKRRNFEWRIEFAAPALLGLPDDAIAPAPQGLLGQGANYYKANDNATEAVGVFAKQAWLRFKTDDGRWQARLGRFEFSDGAETTPANGTLAAVKRTRLAQRMIGPFGFTHVGRSFDGIDLQYGRGATRVTLMGALPTTGVFDVDGWGWVDDVALGYGAVTTRGLGTADRSEFRLFGMYYRDGREEVVKVDNRPLAARQADQEAVNVNSVGGHYLQLFPTGSGPFDLMLWGVYQFGTWGALDHAAWAAAAELGWQPGILKGMKPWLRVGGFAGSGDDDNTDGTHGTFFQGLPTPRPHARFPFYNLMNLQEASVSLTLRPGTKTTIRTDVRGLRLAEKNDGWYIGGGAFKDNDFGYAARPSNGWAGLATLIDLSADVRLNSHWTISGYGSYAVADGVVQTIYPSQSNGWLGYLELEWRW
jgi:hypothetical protein